MTCIQILGTLTQGIPDQGININNYTMSLIIHTYNVGKKYNYITKLINIKQ